MMTSASHIYVSVPCAVAHGSDPRLGGHIVDPRATAHGTDAKSTPSSEMYMTNP